MCYGEAVDAADDPGVVWRPPRPSGICEFNSCPERETSARSHPGARQLRGFAGPLAYHLSNSAKVQSDAP
jgi:hypothetical protein